MGDGGGQHLGSVDLDLDLDLDLDAEDIKLIKQQESMFLTQHRIAQVGDAAPRSPSEQQAVLLRTQLDVLSAELDRIRHEKCIKEGEISMLRTKLNQAEQEKFSSSRRHAEKLDEMERERQSMIAHLQNELGRLHTELRFKENELRSTSKADLGQRSPPNGFAAAFSDLNASTQKRPRPVLSPSSMSRVENSCQTDEVPSTALVSRHASGEESVPEHHELMVSLTFHALTGWQNMLYIAIGQADQVFALEDVAESDREKAARISESIRSRAGACQNVFLALGYQYSLYAQGKDAIFLSYVTLIVQFLICSNPRLGPLLRKGNVPCSEHSIQVMTQLVGESPAEPWVVAIMEQICRFILKNPVGKFCSLMRQHLRILKHILAKTTDLMPDCVLALFQSGALLRQVDYFCEKRSIFLLEMTQLILLLKHDRRLSMELLRQDPKLEISIIGFLNEVLSQRIARRPYHHPLGHEERAVICCLYQLVLDRMFPASVAFEPATLRIICRRMAATVWNLEHRSIEDCYSDLKAFVQLLHHVIVVERAPIFKLIHREFFNLLHAAKELVNADQCSQLIRSMMPLLDRVFSDVREGKYLPIPMPPVERRPVPLSEEEEIACYKQILERSQAIK